MFLLAALFFLNKITDIWNFQWIKYLGKGLSYLRTWGIGVNYCWNYWPSKLLLHFIEYSLDQLNSKNTKTAVSSTIQYFEGRSLKKCLSKKFEVFATATTKWRSCKIFAKLNGNHLLMTKIFKLHEYQTIGLMKMHNMSKIRFANNIFSLWKCLVYD